MTYLYITRHGETAWNLEGRFQGRQNSELTERGLLQAETLGRILDREKIDLIISSPIQRARETAQRARGARDIPIILLDELSELDLGAWEGEKLSELKVKEPEQYHRYWHDPFRFEPRGGESFEELIARLGHALTQILKLARGKRALVVTHGMALMAILHHVTGQDFNEIIRQPVLRQTSVTRVKAEEDGSPVFHVQAIGDTSHLEASQLHSPSVSVWEGGNAAAAVSSDLAGQAEDDMDGAIQSPAQSEPFREPDPSRRQTAARLLLEQKLTIATAESLTGGLLASAFIESELGISASFMEGYVTYSNEAKIRDLGVQPQTLARFGAVSEETAREMVCGAQAKSNTDLAISTTGIAGPGGDTPAKPLGLTYIAIWNRGEVRVFREVFTGSRNQIRASVVEYALERLVAMLRA